MKELTMSFSARQTVELSMQLTFAFGSATVVNSAAASEELLHDTKT